MALSGARLIGRPRTGKDRHYRVREEPAKRFAIKLDILHDIAVAGVLGRIGDPFEKHAPGPELPRRLNNRRRLHVDEIGTPGELFTQARVENRDILSDDGCGLESLQGIGAMHVRRI